MGKQSDGRKLKQIEEAHEEQNYALARELCRRYIAMYPKDLEGQWLHAVTLFLLNCNKEAKSRFEAALPQFSEEYRGGALTFLARLLREEGDLIAAERLYSEAIEADPECSDNYVELGSILLSCNRILEAEAIAQKGLAAKAFPLADLYSFLGELHRTNGDIAEAYKSFHKVLDEQDDDETEAAIEDLRQAAEVLEMDLPVIDTIATEESDSDEQTEHEPGQMTANIQREFFVKILSGEKKIEYRTFNEYWQTRVENAGPPPFHLRIINGMNKSAPELTVVVEKVLINPWADEYELHLGDVLEVKNWDRTKQD